MLEASKQTRGWGEAAGAVRSPVRSSGETQFTLPCRQPGLTIEAPSVPVSHYKSGVTQSAEDNRPTASNQTAAQAPPACKSSHRLHAHSLSG